MLNKKSIAKVFGIGVIATSLFVTPSVANATSTDGGLGIPIEEMQKIEEFCETYNVEMSNDPDFINEVQAMLKERNENNPENEIKSYSNISIATRSSSSSSSGGNPLMKSRYIPTSSVADIIWTNNPVTPFNHVGLYTKTNKITEALLNGVKTRTVGKNMKEYPFVVYKVSTTKDGSARYSYTDRKLVATWGENQVGKDYDTNFANNKKNTTANNKKMNCSELVWKSWKFKKNVDLDSNGGPGVYPNNIKNSKLTKQITTG